MIATHGAAGADGNGHAGQVLGGTLTSATCLQEYKTNAALFFVAAMQQICVQYKLYVQSIGHTLLRILPTGRSRIKRGFDDFLLARVHGTHVRRTMHIIRFVVSHGRECPTICLSNTSPLSPSCRLKYDVKIFHNERSYQLDAPAEGSSVASSAGRESACTSRLRSGSRGKELRPF